MKKIIIAIDFDGTIIEHKFPDIGPLKLNAKEVINKLYEEGYYIIIWTCRGGSELLKVYDFMKNKGFLYHKINENRPFRELGFAPFPKIYADIYIDDKNLGSVPDDWEDIYLKDICLIEENIFT